MDENEYIYEIINNENDAKLCAQLLAEEFCISNPITIFDQIKPTVFYNETSWPTMKDVYEEHLSFLVRVRSTGEIVGAVAAGDLYLQHERKRLSTNQSNILPSKIPVGDLIDELDESFISKDFGEELKANTVLHIVLCAVRSQYSKFGIASRFRQVISDYARNTRGFQYLLLQATHPATRHIYVNKMNGKEVTIIDPTTWIWKKNSNGLLNPYKDYKGGLIPNILVKL